MCYNLNKKDGLFKNNHIQKYSDLLLQTKIKLKIWTVHVISQQSPVNYYNYKLAGILYDCLSLFGILKV